MLAGGLDSSGERLNSGEIFDPETRAFSPAVTIMGMARLRPALRVLPDGKVQVIGGDKEVTMEMFNPEAQKFTALAHLTE